MFNFNLHRAEIYQAVKWEKFPLFRFADFFKSFFFGIFLVVFILFLYGFLPQNFSQETSKILLGLSMIFFFSSISIWLKGKFFEKKLKHPKLEVSLSVAALNPENYNIAEFLSFKAAKGISTCLKEEPTSIALLYFLLKDNPELEHLFSRLLLDMEGIKRTLKKEIDSTRSKENLQGVILEALKIAQEKNHSRIEIGDTLSALARTNFIFKRILVSSNLKPEDIDNLVLWLESVKKERNFWDYKTLLKKGNLAKNWTAGYTVFLDKFSIDLTESLKGKDLEFSGHEEDIKTLERVLSRKEINNVLLIGRPGSGRKSIVYALAQESVFGETRPEVAHKRVVELDMVSLLSQLEDPEEVESALDKIFQEVVSAGNIILVVEDFHNYIGQETKPGVIDISGAIAPYLRFPEFQIIAITSYEGFHRNIEKNSSILSLFEKVEVSEISKENTLLLLEKVMGVVEKRYNLFVTYFALRQIVYLTDRYMSSEPFPEKALDILDEAAVFASSLKDKILLPKHISKIITKKTEIPVGELETKEKEILLDLENLIHRKIINQEEAVREVSTALRRARSEVTVRQGPMGTFLFMGPTGVGKTETSKALAEVYFGSKNRMIRLDMSEFQSSRDVSRLIGSSEQEGILTIAVKEDPFSLVLLDEIEKAHPNVLDLFLQVLDEGHLTDSLGRKIDFRSTIIIATSNAGYKVILKAIKEKGEWSKVKEELLDYVFNKRIFKPEFINRFDAVVVFGPLSKANLLNISELMLQSLKKNLEEKGIEFEITDNLKKKIVELGYNPTFGAREMRRVIQDKVENVLASALLSGEMKRGDSVKINSENFSLVIK